MGLLQYNRFSRFAGLPDPSLEAGVDKIKDIVNSLALDIILIKLKLVAKIFRGENDFFVFVQHDKIGTHGKDDAVVDFVEFFDFLFLRRIDAVQMFAQRPQLMIYVAQLIIVFNFDFREKKVTLLKLHKSIGNDVDPFPVIRPASDKIYGAANE